MCTVVPYEYMSVGDVVNGLIYLILSSPTRVDAVWRALACPLRPFKEGEKLLLRPLYNIFTNFENKLIKSVIAI